MWKAASKNWILQFRFEKEKEWLSYSWVNIHLGKANSYSNRLLSCKTAFKWLVGNWFQSHYSWIIISSFFFFFWTKLSLPRLIGLIFGHFQKSNSLSKNKCLPPLRRKLPHVLKGILKGCFKNLWAIILHCWNKHSLPRWLLWRN